jgi:hypothetical protein
MKYKVILFNTGSQADTDVSGNFDFFVKATAQACCSSWAQTYGANSAMLFDGITWGFINP